MKLLKTYKEKNGGTVAELYQADFIVDEKQVYQVRDTRAETSKSFTDIERAKEYAESIVDSFDDITFEDVIEYFTHIPANL